MLAEFLEIGVRRHDSRSLLLQRQRQIHAVEHVMPKLLCQPESLQNGFALETRVTWPIIRFNEMLHRLSTLLLRKTPPASHNPESSHGQNIQNQRNITTPQPLLHHRRNIPATRMT